MIIGKPTNVTTRRRRERYWVAAVMLLIVICGYLEGWFYQFRADLPPLGNFLLFALINLNVLLLLLLAYLLLRNIVKLVFERKKSVLGSNLRTRLVVAFVGVTLIPTVPLFGLATQFISFSLDYWFSQQVEQSLEQSVALGKDLLGLEKAKLAADGRAIGAELQGLAPAWSGGPVSERREDLDALLRRHDLLALIELDPRQRVPRQIWRDDIAEENRRAIVDFLRSAAATAGSNPRVLYDDADQVFLAPVPISDSIDDAAAAATTVAATATTAAAMVWAVQALPEGVADKLNAVSSGYENYLQLKLLQHPLKVSHFIVFSIVTLLVIFGAVWLGFTLARSITVPIQELLSATERIAQGDLEVRLDWSRQDEMGRLVASFNKMVHDLGESRRQLAGAYAALQDSHVELERRRRYMEIVLTNIGAGVASVDSNGVIVTLNRAAEGMFGVAGTEAVGRPYSEVLEAHQLDIVKSFVAMHQLSRQQNLEQQCRLMIGNKALILLIKVSILRDERDRYLGVVAVFEDLTDLEKAHRMAAWREVARRIAHEIKNPLTPIQLSAQRLRRRYPELVNADQGIFDECTRMIVDQVAQMKLLVNEFSNFARLPQANPVPCRLLELIQETLTLYRHGYPRVSFELEESDPPLPVLRIDRDQFQRVMVNLLDNAVHALDGEVRRVEVRLSHDPVLRIARIELADTGSGLSAEDKLRIFEPYYSKKDKGTGLGLAIVASIVADHHGFVRVRDNLPKGTVMVIELPT